MAQKNNVFLYSQGFGIGRCEMKKIIKRWLKEFFEFDLHLCAIESVMPLYHRGARK